MRGGFIVGVVGAVVNKVQYVVQGDAELHEM
jgi:hypothetical protein